MGAVSGSFRFLVALGFGLLTGDFLATINVAPRLFVFDTGVEGVKTSLLRDLVTLVGTGLIIFVLTGLDFFALAGLSFLVALELLVLDLGPRCFPLVSAGVTGLASGATLPLPRVLFGEGFSMFGCGSMVSSACWEALKVD